MKFSPNFFSNHLQVVDETYGQHFLHASYYFMMLAIAAVCALTHAFLPFLFETTSSQIILKLHAKMTTRQLFEAK